VACMVGSSSTRSNCMRGTIAPSRRAPRMSVFP